MITNPKAKRIIFYGDSLVWGKVPGVNTQFPADVRLTGILQQRLGNEYDIIEAGLRARNLVGDNPYFNYRDGLVTFSPILGSLLPADAVVIFLGSNDTNNKPNFSAAEVADSLESYQALVTEWASFLQCPTPKLAIILPPRIHEDAFDEPMAKIFTGAAKKLDELRKLLRQKADTLHLPVFDAGIVEPDDADGIHLSAENNKKLGEALEPFVRSLVK